MDDRELLKQFLEDRDQQAFTELVNRHIDMVYSAALRQVKDSAVAEDVAQHVFVRLATKGRTIRQSEALIGWLLSATRFAALDALRARQRRRHHENEAAAMKHEAHKASADWDSIEPVLDEVMAQLKPADRDALALRFFKNLSLADVGSVLGISEQAAHKRIDRAMSRLRTLLEGRGAASSAQAISTALVSHSIGRAPETLAANVAQAASATASTTISKGAVTLMATTKAKITIGAVAVLILAGITASVVYYRGKPSAEIKLVTIAPTSPSTAPAWQSAFNTVYGLKPGESIKWVGPPYIPERDEFMRANFDAQKFGPPLRGSYSMYLSWDAPKSQLQIKTIGETDEGHNLLYVLQRYAGIWQQNIDIPPNPLWRNVHGDWIMREGATQAEIIADLSKVISAAYTTREVLGVRVPQQVALQATMEEREAIVVSGTFRYQSLTGYPFLEPDTVYIYRGEPQQERPGMNGYSNLSEFAQWLGTILRRPVVVEASSASMESKIRWRRQRSVGFDHPNPPPDGAAVDEILSGVAKQTSLTLKREKRSVQIWRLVPVQQK